MSYEVKTIEVQSSDNIHTLKGVIYIPEGEIKGIFHIVHGMCEHIKRYSHIFAAAAENGFIACGYDNLGHGETARDDQELGFIAHRDGWKYLVKDVIVFEEAIKKLYPNNPIYLMGHSMGSFISRIAVEEYGENIDKFIICGTGGPNPASPFGLFAIDVMNIFYSEKHRSNFINNLAFGAYNKRFSGESEYEWVTSDRNVIKKYSEDKFCTYKFTISAMHDLIKLNSLANRKAWFNTVRKDLPIFIISGTLDPVGNYGKGVRVVFNKLKAAGVKDVSFKLYENNRHEIHNDISKDEVIRDIIEFLKG